MTKIKTLNDMHQLARLKGGRCLSENYTNAKTKLYWECDRGHQWQAVPSSIQQGTWCPSCAHLGTIDKMSALAEKRSGMCLSNKYINYKAKLTWECVKGHQWEATPQTIENGTWCPICGSVSRKTIEEMHALAKSRDGFCLSSEYINSTSPLLWQCRNDHKWEATYHSVFGGGWCPACAKNKRHTIEEMQSLARKHRGKCLSSEYINVETKLSWECKNKHQWEDAPRKILKGMWCPVCTGRKPASYKPKARWTIQDMQALAKTKQGLCLSSKYINTETKLLWQCESGHKWSAKPHSILKGTWCPECSAKRRRLTLEDMKLAAKKRGGRCLASSYKNLQTKIQWECSKGHSWEATGANVVFNNTWCPVCASN